MNKQLKIFLIFSFTIGAIFLPVAAHALLPISGTGSWGSFTGTMNYSATDSLSAMLEIYLENNSPVANGGYITAFVFNNPSNLITGISLSSTDTDFDIIVDPDNVNAAPNGQFDIGVSTGDGYEGGGAPQLGIAVGVDEMFTFSLTGTSLNTLTEQDFLDELSVGTGAGSDYEPFVVRFRGFINDQSDKVPLGDHAARAIPEPASMLLLGSGLLGLIGFYRKRS